MSQETVGIIVGRFHCSYLHAGYEHLIRWVSERHSKVIIFIGNSPLKVVSNDPLPFESRMQMVPLEYQVYALPDVGNVPIWSKLLDKKIEVLLSPNQTPILYGSRDKFAYTGKYPVVEVPEIPDVSSTNIRRDIAREIQDDRKWREGVIWASQNKYPIVHPTVDMAVLNFNTNCVLLGRKPNEILWRLPGGFADVGSESYEADAIREVKEETDLEVVQLEYVGSMLVDDWRYRNQRDKIKTLLYAVTQWRGQPKAGDDLEQVEWFPLEAYECGQITDIVPNHVKLLQMLFAWKNNLKKSS